MTAQRKESDKIVKITSPETLEYCRASVLLDSGQWDPITDKRSATRVNRPLLRSFSGQETQTCRKITIGTIADRFNYDVKIAFYSIFSSYYEFMSREINISMLCLTYNNAITIKILKIFLGEVQTKKYFQIKLSIIIIRLIALMLHRILW